MFQLKKSTDCVYGVCIILLKIDVYVIFMMYRFSYSLEMLSSTTKILILCGIPKLFWFVPDIA